MTQDLAAFARQLKAVLGDEQRNSIKEIITSIESLSKNFDKLVVDYKNMISLEDKKKINNSISNIEKVSELLVSQFKQMSEISNKTDQVVQSLDAFDDSMNILNNFFTNLDNGNGTLNKLVYEDKIHNNLDSLIYDFRSLIKDINDNPLKYMKAYIKAQGS